MPHYSIQVENGNGFINDEEGAEYLTSNVARIMAIRTSADIIADELKKGCMAVKINLFIDDANHSRITSVPMSATIG